MLGARGPMLEVVADASFLIEPVSCEVSNAVGSANRSTALDVQCERGRGPGCGQSGGVGGVAATGCGRRWDGKGCRQGLAVLGQRHGEQGREGVVSE